MTRLNKALKSEAEEQREVVEQFNPIIEAQKLLADSSSADFQMLKDMGMHSNATALMNIQGNKLELKKVEEQYGEVYTIKEIQAVCEKYALRFLRSDNFKGQVDAVLPQKMREFAKKAGFELTFADLNYKVFIMAPYNVFNLQDTPAKPKPDPDPIVFYKVSEDKYALVHQWGTDLSIFRQLIGLKYRNGFTYWAFWTMLIAAFVFPLVASVLTVTLWGVFGLSLFSMFVGIIVTTAQSGDEIANPVKSMNEIWNKPVKNRY